MIGKLVKLVPNTESKPLLGGSYPWAAVLNEPRETYFVLEGDLFNQDSFHSINSCRMFEQLDLGSFAGVVVIERTLKKKGHEQRKLYSVYNSVHEIWLYIDQNNLEII